MRLLKANVTRSVRESFEQRVARLSNSPTTSTRVGSHRIRHTSSPTDLTKLKLNLSHAVLRIRIYYYADPGYQKCPYGSESQGVLVNTKEEKLHQKMFN